MSEHTKGRLLVRVTDYPHHGPAFDYPLEDLMLGKMSVRGNNTQFTMGRTAAGAVVSIPHAKQSKEAIKELRRRLKGIWADTGYGVTAVSQAFRWESIPDDKSLRLQGCVTCGRWGKDSDGRLMCCCDPTRYAEMHPTLAKDAQKVPA